MSRMKPEIVPGTKQFISLGAGVQSSTMALMAMHGEIGPPPDAAIFADTGAEPEEVYQWLDYLEPLLDFPVYRVMYKEGLQANIEESLAGGRFAGAPFFTESDAGREGRLRRQCTKEFKIQPVERKMRELCGIQPGQQARKLLMYTWQGISTDEIQRARRSTHKWQEFRYPLLENRVSRQDCINWMEKQGYERPPRSACIWCPYHNDAEWRRMKAEDPGSWSEAVRMDEMIRGGVRGTEEKLYLHRSLKPLAEIDFRNATDVGQVDMFEEECEGMCGL